ncbi:hypothetical protein HOLleu_36900 [Holothuria leucospilota]|uniref:Uncharacterized protein n=1 Tax=Holothuria leucospilota TaxID=206669 RepID=A0A9Q1BF21_HOLLE|nr:hypothetical protein HOLleu_36900 [Holothuria leucospilota]
MSLKVVLKLAVSIFAFWGSSRGDGHTVTLSHGAWKGTVGYIAVDRSAVQEKLDFYNSHVVSPGGTPLFLPLDPVFPHILNKTQHVLYVDFGTLTVFECDTPVSGDWKSCPSVSRSECTTAIPLLTDDPHGIPKYSLALNIFQQRTDVPNINIVFPHTPVDEVTVDGDGATIRDSNEEILVSVTFDEDTCKPNPTAVSKEFEEFFNEELQFGIFGPDFSYCDDYPNHHFCSVVNSIRGGVQQWASNVCQLGWGAPVAGSCQVPLSILNITPGFRERLLLEENDPVNFIASEHYDQEFDAVVKFPCVAA